MRKTLIAAACGLALALGTAGCGGSDQAISQAKLADRLADAGTEQELAACVAKKIYPDLTEDEKKAFSQDERDAETGRRVLLKAGEATDTCLGEGRQRAARAKREREATTPAPAPTQTAPVRPSQTAPAPRTQTAPAPRTQTAPKPRSSRKVPCLYGGDGTELCTPEENQRETEVEDYCSEPEGPVRPDGSYKPKRKPGC